MTGPWLFSYIVLWVLFLVLAMVQLSILRNLGLIYTWMNELNRGAAADSPLVTGSEPPPVRLTDALGQPAPLSRFNGEKTAIVVVSEGCEACRRIVEQIAAGKIQPDPRDRTVRRSVVLFMGPPSVGQAWLDQTGLPAGVQVLFDPELEVATQWGVNATPLTVVLDEELRVKRQILGS